MTTGPEAGYYADPSIPGYIRYWDGAQWVVGTSRPAPAELRAEGAKSAEAPKATEMPKPIEMPKPAEAAKPAQAVQKTQQPMDVWMPEPLQAQAPVQAPAEAQVQAPAEVPVRPVVQPQVPAQAPVREQPPVQAPPQPLPRVPVQSQTPAQAPTQIPAQALFQPQAPAQVPFQTPAQAPIQAPAPVQAPPRQPEPERFDPEQFDFESQSLSTMVVPSAFANAGAYNNGWAGGGQAGRSPFAGLPGFTGEQSTPEEEPERQAKVARLASPGSRLLAKIIDIFLALLMSTPATVTLILIAHRHDHQYVEGLRLKATAPYTTLGMDATGIALWIMAALALLLVALLYEAFRVGGTGQTTGRRLLGIRVVKAGTADRLGGGAALLRGLLFWIFVLLPVINILTLGSVLWGRPYHQGLHDKIARAVTIKDS